MRLALLIILLCTLGGCGRTLSEGERAFAAQIHGDALDMTRVRLIRGALVGSVTFQRKARPRLTCRERIYPPARNETVTTRPAAVALFNRVFFSNGWYLPDYQPDYPERIYLVEAMLLAHELTHVWQWQNRELTGYSPLRAVSEHGNGADPYLFELVQNRDFLSFGYEQQGAIVEEYICCRSLAPRATRTRRLHAMIGAVMPLSPLPRNRPAEVILPWDGADTDAICD